MPLRRLSTLLTTSAIALVLLAALPALSGAQQGTITGRVTEVRTAQPVSDARVTVVGTSLLTTTNA